MALINTTTTGVLGTTLYGDGAGSLTVQKDGVTQGIYGNIPAFCYTKSANQTGIAQSTWTKVTFPLKDFDTNNNFDTTNNRFIPTIAGYYQINMTALFVSGSAASDFYLQAYKNGSATSPVRYINFNSLSTPTCHLTFSFLIYMNGTTDYLEAWIYTNAASSNTINNGGTGFSGFLAKAA
jgi:hypothetical protein